MSKKRVDKEPEKKDKLDETEESEKSKPEKDIVEERIYTIPLGKAWIAPVKKRSPRAVKIIRSFMNRHMKPEVLSISNDVNLAIWKRGIENPPRRIKVRAARDKNGLVTVFLAKEE